MLAHRKERPTWKRRPEDRLLPKFLLTASIANHLEGCNSQITVLLFAGCLLNPSLFFFAGSGTSDRHLVADMLVKLNANAPQAPDLAVFADDGKFARLVAFLQAPGYGLGMTPEFLICFSFACGYGLAFCSANFRKERP